MPVNFVLIDYENIRPRNLELLTEFPAKVFVFVGQGRAKIPFDLADSMQFLGKHARYVRVDGSGRNSLDYYLAYYVGDLSAREPDAEFFVISRQKGFDPLIRHLCENGIRVQRVTDLGEIPPLQLSDKSSMDEKISAVVRSLGGRGQSRPRKVTTLQKMIGALFTRKLDQKALNEIVSEMKRRKLIVVNENSVSYKLPH